MSRPPSSLRRAAIRCLAPVLAAAVILGASRPALAATESQVWAFFKVVDKQTIGQKLEIQLPIEVIRDLGTLRFWNKEHKKVIGTIDGALVYRTYKDLPVGKEEKVTSIKDAAADLVLVVSSKEKREGTANALRVQVLDRTDNTSLDNGYPFSTLDQTMRTFFDTDVWGAAQLKDRIEGIDRLPYNLGALSSVPAYTIVKLDGGDHRVIVKTE